MSTPRLKSHDVIIAGAGPVGLFLACELRLVGCSVLVLEKAPDPNSTLKGPPFGLRGLTSPTTDSLDRRDLLDALTSSAAGIATPGAHWMRQQQRLPGGHFAGIQFFHDRVDTTRWPYRLPGIVSNIATDMASIETVLAARAHALGVKIRRGCGFESFEPAREWVTVRAGATCSGEAGSSVAMVGAVVFVDRRGSASPGPPLSSQGTRFRRYWTARAR